MSEIELCEECGLPLIECSARASARMRVEEYLRENGYGGPLAKKRASDLIPERAAPESAPKLAAAVIERARAMPTMRKAFRTTESGLGRYAMKFKFRTMEEMHAADDEWREFFR